MHAGPVRRAVATLVLGLVLLAAGFAWGTSPRSAVLGGDRFTCDAVVPSSWLVPGAAAATRPGATSAERRACAAATAPVRWAVGGLLGLGALLALVGWTAAREMGSPVDQVAAYDVA